MAFKTYQALICWAAAKTIWSDENGNPTDMSAHSVANGMDDCTSYSSHKHIDREPIEAFMGAEPGRGVVGFWSFRDGSKLVALCSDWDPVAKVLGPGKFVYISPAENKDEIADPRPSQMHDLRTWGSGELRKQDC